MKGIINKILSGRGIALALIACLASSAWAVEVPTPVVVWDGDFSSLTKTVEEVTYTIENVTGSGESTASANSVGSDKSYLQIAAGAADGVDNNVAAPTVTATGGASPFGSVEEGSTVLVFVSGLPSTAGSNRALLMLMDGDHTYGGGGSGHARYGIARAKNQSYGGDLYGGFIKDGAINTSVYTPAKVFTENKMSVALTYDATSGLSYYVDGELMGTYNPSATDFNTISGVCIGGVDYTSSSWFYRQNSMKIHTVAIFNRALSASEIAEYESQSKWRYCDAIAWRNITGDFHTSTYAPVSSVSATASASNTRSYATSGEFLWSTYLRTDAKCPIAIFYDTSGKQQEVGGDFSNLYIGGLNVTATPSSGIYTLTGKNANGQRETMLGDKTGNHESWFVFDESYTISRAGSASTTSSLLYGTVNMQIADGKTFSFNSGANTAASNLVMTAGTSNTAAPQLKMIGAGTFTVPHLNASTGKLDYSALDPSSQATKPFINGLLTVSDNTTYAFPALSGAATYKAANKLSADATRPTTFTIGENEYTAPLTFTASTGEIAFPAVATLAEGAMEVANVLQWDNIVWDATPAPISSTTPVVINVTDDTLLMLTSPLSVKSLVFNISAGKTLRIYAIGGITATEGFTVTGGGTFEIYGTALNVTGNMSFSENATLAFHDMTTDRLTVNGTLTVPSGKTLTLAPATITGASATILSATSISGTIALSAPTESGYTYTMLETATTRKLVRTPNVAFSYDGTIGATPSGWFTAWGGEGFGDRLRVGPNSDRSIVYEVYHDSDNAKAHPYYDLSARSAFSFALYADVSQVGSDGRKVLASFGTASGGLVLYRQGDYVRVGHVTSSGFTGGWAASVAIPASGYHLYTVTYDPNGTIALYLDDGASSSSSSTLGSMSLNNGMQIGGMYQGVPTADVFNDAAFAQGVGMAFAAIRCYDAVLAAGNVEALAQQFPATDNSYTHTVDLNATGKTLTVYSTAFTGSCYLGVSDGALVIPENNTVSVPHVRLQESAGTVTADIYGRLEVTSVSTGPNVHWDGDANNYKGILFGKASGAGTGSVTIHSTGALVAPNAWLQTVFQAGNQTITIDGGLMQVKGLFSDLANKSSLVLQNGGILEVDSVTDRGQSIAANFRYGTFRIASDVTLPNELSTAFTGTLAQPTTLDPYGNTLTLQSAALTGSGDITVNDSSDGGNGKVVFIGGSSYAGRLIMTDANAANIDISGYTGTVLCQGTAATTIAMFDGFEGTVYFTDDVDATAIDLSGAKVVVADNVIYTATIGKEGAMTLGAGAVAKLVGTTESQIKYDGYVPNIIGSGSVQYWDAAETPVQIVDGYTIDGNSETTGLISGVNLVPYYYVWEIGAGDTAGIATGSDGWSRIDDHVRPVDNKNIAFHIQGTAGQVTTITVDDNATFGSIVVYGTGTAKFVSSENKTIAVTTLVADTPVQICQGAVAVSGIIRDNSSVAFTGTQTISVEITGTGAVYVGDGTTTSDITFAHCNSFAGGMIVKSNAKTTTTSGARADGVGTGFGAYGGTVTVYTGGQVDVANTSGVCYDYVIEDGGESETPALTNSGSVIGIDARQARSLTVNADAIIECPASKGWGLVNNNHDTANLTLKKGTTLTKKGAGTFILCNTDISNSGSTGELPKLVIAEGNVSTENTGSGGAGAWDIDIEDGGKLLLERGIGARNITVKNGGKITMSSSDGWLNGLTALTIDAGGEVDCSGTSRTGNLINATTLTVNGTLNMGTHIGQISATTIAGSGTIVYAGVASKNPAADKIFSTQAGWTGTVKLSAITGDNRICTEFGHSNSHLQLAGAEGYFMASASGTEFSVPVEFVDGTLGYAWKMKSGWTDSSTGRSITLLDTISGTGKIWHPSTSTVGHCYVFKTATGYSGSILIENANGAIIEFGSTAPGQGARSYGSINVASTGSAVIGSGQSWQATNGIKIEGQVTLEGAATMASPVIASDSAKIILADTPLTISSTLTATALEIDPGEIELSTSEPTVLITGLTNTEAPDVSGIVVLGCTVSVGGESGAYTITATLKSTSWTGASGTWSASAFNGGDLVTDGEDVSFMPSANAAVTVTLDGTRAPANVTFNGGAGTTYTLTGGAFKPAGTVTVESGTVIINSAATGTYVVKSGAVLKLSNATVTSVSGAGTLEIPQNGTVTVSASDAISVGVLKGPGTLAVGANIPNATLQTLLKNANWDGMLELYGVTDNAQRDLHNMGNTGSKIKLKGVEGYMPTETINAEVVFENGTGGYAYNILDSWNTATTFRKISGTGLINDQATGKVSGHPHVFRDAEGFTGSIDKTANRRFFFSKTRDSGFPDVNGIIFIDTDGLAKIGDGNYWKASTGGIRIDGTLELAGSAELKSAVTLSNGATLKFDDLSSSKKLTLSSTLTFASGTVSVEFSAAALESFTNGKQLVDWSANGAAPGGTFTFDDGTDNKVEDEVRYVLLAEADGLYLREAVAQAITSGSVVTYHATVAAAISAAGNGGTVVVLKNTTENVVYDPTSLTLARATTEITTGTVSSAEYGITAGTELEDGVYKYTYANRATTYYWAGASGANWSTVGNWRAGSAEGPVATRAITSIDSVNLGAGASVTLTEAVPGVASLVGATTAQITAGSIDNIANITTQLKNTDWKGALAVSCSSNTGNIPFENWGNEESKILASDVSGWLTTGNSPSTNNIPAEVVFENGSEGYALNIVNANSYDRNNSATRLRLTAFRKISGTGTIQNSNVPTRPLLVFKNATAYSGSIVNTLLPSDGSLYSNGMIISFSASVKYPEAKEGSDKTAGARIYVMDDGYAVIGNSKAWTAGNGISIDGTVELLGAGTFNSAATFGNGAKVKFNSLNTSSFALNASAGVTVAAGDSVEVLLGDGVTLESGLKLISWTSAPAGTFTFENGEQYKAASGAYYVLDKEDDGLYIHQAVAADYISAQPPHLYSSVAKALSENNSVDLIAAPSETVTLPFNKTINNPLPVSVSSLVVNPATDEYNQLTISAPNGIYSMNNATPKATTYYWTGAGEGNAWTTHANWAVDAADGPTATRAITPSDSVKDSVVFSGNATVTLGAQAKCLTMAVDGAVSMSGDYALVVYGNVTGSGTLSLDNVCLGSDADSQITVAPSVSLSNSAALAGSNGIQITGNVGISGTIKTWNTTHSITGTTTLGGNFTLQGNNGLSLGPVTVLADTTPTLDGATLTLSGAVTVDASATFTIPASGVTVGNGATFVLAGFGAQLTDNRDSVVAAGKVSTTVDGATVVYDSTSKTYSVRTDIVDDEEQAAGYVDPTGTAVITDSTKTVTVPATVTRLELNMSSSIGTITAAGVPAANVTVKYGATDTTGAYSIGKSGDTITLDINTAANAAVGGVKVRAEVAATDPMTIDSVSDNAKFKVKSIPGLWYAVKAAGSLADLDSNYKYGTPVQATGDTLTVEAPDFPGTVLYYQIGTGADANDLTKYIISQTQIADGPVADGLFQYGETGWNHDVYRIPAMAATPDGTTVMGIFDARFNYQDLGVRLTSEGYNADTASPDHYTGIDIAGCYSLDSGASWSGPQIMIDVPNASDPKTGDKTTELTKAMELGDPCIVYDSANSKFIMMGITGGGLTTPTDTTSNAILADVVMYECTLASVQSGNPIWVGPVSVKAAIETALQTADTAANNFTYPASFTGDGYLGILEGPGHAFVTRAACGDIPANTVVWPMQYIIRQGGRWTLKGGNFAAWKDGSGDWHTTKLVPNSGDGKNYVTQEGCLTQLDNGHLFYMCKNVTTGTRPFYKSADGVNWTYCNEISPSQQCQGSMLRIGAKDGVSRYVAVFATGNLRSAIKAYIGIDDTASGGSVTWDTAHPIDIWPGATGTASDGTAGHGNLVYGYNSLVMLDATTLGVLFEANGHIYFTKIDVSSALK